MKSHSSKSALAPSLLDAIFTSIGELAFILDRQGCIRHVSGGVDALLGDRSAPLQGRSWAELCDPVEEAQAVFAGTERGRSPVYFHTRLVDAKGQRHPVVFSLQVLAKAEESAPYCLALGYGLERSAEDTLREDATELSERVAGLQESLASVNRKMAETALQLAEERQKLNAVTASLGEGMLVLDTEQRITQAGGTAEKLLGLSKEALLGKTLAEVLPKLHARIASESLEDRGSQPLSQLVKDVRFNHAGKVLRANLAPIVDSERRDLGTVIIFEDFTRLAEIDRIKSELISIVSHELRTPLSSIKGYLDLLLEADTGSINETQHEYLSIAKANAERLVDMLDVMLDIERIEAGRLQIGREPVDLTYVGHYVYSAFRPQAGEKRIELRRQFQDGLMVQADLDRVIQILSNLVSNAIKYTPPGGQVIIRTRGTAEQATLEVVDTGLGISADEQKRLFDKFYRVPSSTSVKGAGLGLSITKHLVEAHGGTITVSSRQGKGSTFSVVLPSDSSGQPEAVSPS